MQDASAAVADIISISFIDGVRRKAGSKMTGKDE